MILVQKSIYNINIVRLGIFLSMSTKWRAFPDHQFFILQTSKSCLAKNVYSLGISQQTSLSVDRQRPLTVGREKKITELTVYSYKIQATKIYYFISTYWSYLRSRIRTCFSSGSQLQDRFHHWSDQNPVSYITLTFTINKYNIKRQALY